MLEKIKRTLFYADVDKDAYKALRNKIEQSNIVTMTIFSLVAFILTTIMTLLYVFVIRAMSEAWVVFIFGVFGSLLIFVLSVMCRTYPKLSYFTVYLAITLFMMYGILMGTLCRPTDVTVTFMVLMAFMPLLFVDRPIRLIGTLVFFISVFLIAACNTKEGRVLVADISNAVMFGALAIISVVIIVRVKIHSFLLEYRLQHMSEMDQLTGLHNRNSYEWHFNEYPLRCQTGLGCVYIDVNGLHELNDAEGHKAGDLMLQTIASYVRQIFGGRDTYRIGGDEFLAYVVDWETTTIVEKAQQLQGMVSDAGYRVAIGCAYRPVEFLDMNALTMEAERVMYRDKDEYYRVSGKKRRGA